MLPAPTLPLPAANPDPDRTLGTFCPGGESKGYRPHNITYSITPQLQMSATLPLYRPSRLTSTSGAMYVSVPTCTKRRKGWATAYADQLPSIAEFV